MPHSQTIVLGLGNPGERYAGTRHNVGFDVVDRLAERRGARLRRSRWWRPRAYLWCGGDVVLVKPNTFMNRSGEAAVEVCRRFDVPAARLIAVYDDADLELGRLRLRHGGGDGGHNGVRSLIAALGTREFPRIRLGVAGRERRERGLADYLLTRFDAAEVATVRALVGLAADAAERALEAGVERAMNEFNARSVAMGTTGGA